MFNVIIIVIIKSFKVRNVRLHVISVSKRGIFLSNAQRTQSL